MSDYDHRDDYEALFDKTYLRWFHLQGEPALVKIVEVERKELTMRGGVKKRSGVLTLSQIRGKIENIKPLVLNTTNSETIAELFGRKPSEWKGRQIVLFVSETNLKGKPVPCIRIRAPKQKSN